MIDAIRTATSDVFKLDCWCCARTVQLRTQPASHGIANCPRCGARLELDWGSLARECQQAPSSQQQGGVL